MLSQELEIFWKIFARGIEYCLAMRFFLNYKGGYLQDFLQLLPAGRSQWIEKIFVKKFGEYTSDTLPLCRNEKVC
jgi:hypothetical protein